MAESTDVVRHAPQDVAAMSDADLERMYRVAKALALSKRFPDAKTPDEAFAKVLLGRDLGMSPTQALTGIHIVEGKPQIAAVSLAAFVRKSERYDYVIEEHDSNHCRLSFWAFWTDEPLKLGESTFTIERARKAGLKVDNPNSNWSKYPENMLFARAMSNGVKWFCPDLMGGVPIYTEGDTFEGTATEVGGLTQGHGDGSEPGWGNLSVEQVTAIEGVIERAQAVGHAGLADRATAQMALSGQPDSVVAMWIARGTQELDQFTRREWQTEPEPPSEAPQTEADHEQLQNDLDRVLDQISAVEAEGHDVPRELHEEQERIEGLLGHDDAQETMGL